MKRLHIVMLAWASVVYGADAVAEEGDWQIRTDLQGLYGPYENSGERDELSNFGVFLHADYLEKGGFSLGYNRTTVGFADASADIDQDQIYASARVSLTPDWARGRIGLRVDGHWVDNNDDANGTGDLDVLAPQISYLNFAKTFYADVGYARSSYGDATAFAGELTVDQLSPTLGFGFNEGRDWLQFRGYLVDISNPARAQGLEDTTAVELKWRHWFDGRGPLGLDNLTVTGLGGERIFGVDPDTAAIYNIADVQKGSAAIGGQWRLGDNSELLLQLGNETFTNETIGDDYDSLYMYVDFTRTWD